MISEKLFSDRRGEVLFHRIVSSEQFALVPCIADAFFGSIKPYPIWVRGQHPRMKDIPFDLPQVIDRAKEKTQASGLSDRCKLVFDSVFPSIRSFRYGV